MCNVVVLEPLKISVINKPRKIRELGVRVNAAFGYQPGSSFCGSQVTMGKRNTREMDFSISLISKVLINVTPEPS